MAGVNQTLSLTDKMSAVFSRIRSAGEKTQNTFNKIGQSSDKMQERLNKKSSQPSVFKSILGAGAVQKGISMVTGALDGAISRLDTMNNYPRVMSNLGIDAQSAQASINTLSDGLDGLPTTLDQAALSVQRLTSSNKNIGASTEMFLALNNAILAGRSTNRSTGNST